MQIIDVTRLDTNVLFKTDANIHSANNNTLSVNAIVPEPIAPPVMTKAGAPPTPNGAFRSMPPLVDPAIARENSIKYENMQQQAFFTGDQTIKNYTPGNYSVDIEIILATQSGYAGIVDGKLTPSFSGGVTANSVGGLVEQMNIQLAQERSPLNALQKLDNLKSLYEHLGDNAINYSTEFDTALQGIVDEFIGNGGIYVGADKAGIADSFKAILRGENGKYTAEDMKTMAVLAFEAEAVSDNCSLPCWLTENAPRSLTA